MMIPEIERLTKENDDLRELFDALYQLAGEIFMGDNLDAEKKNVLEIIMLDCLADPDDAIARGQHECLMEQMTPRPIDEDEEELDDENS